MEKPAILVVDDREHNLVALERILQQTDALIVKTGNGNDALKACLNHDFALALLDVNMPGMDGYELAELMRGDKGHSATPIIFLTAAYSHEEQIFKGYSAGAVDYLVKPLRPEILLNKVKVFLDIHRQKQELFERGRELERVNRELQSAKDTQARLATEREQDAEALRQRTDELQEANTLLSESRLAALNMMDDALAARRQAEERSADLRAINEELERFNSASVGRELRMIELKKEINELCRRSGEPPRYSLEFEKEG